MLLLMFRQDITYQPYKSKSLPCSIQSFVGREKEVHNITSLFKNEASVSRVQHVSIVGPPGFGKSTLAIHIGHKLVRSGIVVYYIDMNETPTMMTLAQRILSQANISTEDSIKRVNIWAKELYDRVVLLLDGCDSIINDEFRTFVGNLLTSSPYLQLITTSRQNIIILSSELHHLHELNQLTLHDSSELLGRLVKHRLNSSEKETIANLTGCAPLALQIVGALFQEKSHISPSSVISQLRGKSGNSIIHVLSKVNNSIHLSYMYLTDDVKRIAQYLSCFPGSFDSNAICYVLSMIISDWNCSQLDLLHILTQRSLLQYNSMNDRFQFHILIKEFFKAVNQQPKEIFWKHFINYYTNQVHVIVKSDLRQSLHMLEADKHNIHILLDRISDVDYDIHTLYNVSSALRYVLRSDLFCHQIGHDHLATPTTTVINKMENDENVTRIFGSTVVELYINLVLELEHLLNSTELLVAKLEYINTLIKQYNNLTNFLAYFNYVSQLANGYYKGNLSAHIVLNELLLQGIRELEGHRDCNDTVLLKYYILFLEHSLTALEGRLPHESLLSDITQKYLELGEEYFEAVLKKVSLVITKMYIYRTLYRRYQGHGDFQNANRVAHEAVQHLHDIVQLHVAYSFYEEFIGMSIKFYEEMGKKNESNVLLQHSIDVLNNQGEKTKSVTFLNCTWHWFQASYSSGNFSAAASAAKLLVNNVQNGLSIDYSCVHLMLGLSLYKSKNYSEGLTTLSTAITSLSEQIYTTNGSLIAESCKLLLSNMNFHTECMHPLLEFVMKSYHLIFSFPLLCFITCLHFCVFVGIFMLCLRNDQVTICRKLIVYLFSLVLLLFLCIFFSLYTFISYH